jgi:hypothetical protein
MRVPKLFTYKCKGKTMIDRKLLSALYLDWVNNYLTLDKFAEHHGLYIGEAEALLKVAQDCFENNHPES